MNKMSFSSALAAPIQGVLIPGRARARRKTSGLIVFCIITALIAISLFYVWSRVLAINLGYDLSEAMDKHWKMVGENKKLQVEVALLKNLARIERIAQEELGMEKPLPGQIIPMK